MGHVTPAINSIGESIAPADIIISITALGHRVLRYGLALVIGWIGFIKFTGYNFVQESSVLISSTGEQALVSLTKQATDILEHIDPKGFRAASSRSPH